MKTFEFKDNRLRLDIAGNIFELDTSNPEVIERILNFANEAQNKRAELAAKEDYVEALRETIQFCLDTIDTRLGEEASQKIFAGRTVGLFDCLDVINYIVAMVKEDREARFQAYAPNRVQRRANG